jgi:hypothetical protein
MLIALAVLIGLILLWSALDDAETVIADDADATQDDDAGTTDGDATDDGTDGATDDGTDPADDSTTVTNDQPADETITSTTLPEAEARPAAEVNVLVANGTGGRGVAGRVSDKLKARGYISDASNATNTQTSVIYYDEGFAADARAVAEAINTTPDVIQPTPSGTIAVSADAVDRAESADIVVIVGADDRIPTG